MNKSIKAVVFSLAIIPIIMFTYAFAPAISWGLSRFGDEKIPTCPDGAETLLKQYNGFYVADTDKKEIYLTFDLGYESGYTAQILDTLKKHNLKAIFFLCGNYLKETELVNRMIAEGHYIGNHTDKHKDLPTLTAEGVKTDIMTIQNAFKDQYPNAKPMTFFRPPKGRIDEKTLKIAKENGLRTTMWSIAIVDWGKKPIDADASANKIMSRIHPGAMVLLHIANAGMPKTVEKLIPMLAEKGYTIGDPSNL